MFIIFFLIVKMETKSNINNDKVLLTLLCNDLYYKVKDIVNKYALK